MGPIDQVFGYWANFNHPYIEVEDTAVAVIRFKSGALGNVIVSNSQNPALYGKVHIYGQNGATAGVLTDGGAMFIAGMSTIAEPPVNDVWTIPGEEGLLKQWQDEDSEFFLKNGRYEILSSVADQRFSSIDDKRPRADDHRRGGPQNSRTIHRPSTDHNATISQSNSPCSVVFQTASVAEVHDDSNFKHK